MFYSLMESEELGWMDRRQESDVGVCSGVCSGVC